MRWLASIAFASLVTILPTLPSSAIPAEEEPAPDPHLNDPKPTTILVRVVAHGAMVLGHDVGGARVTISDVETKEVLVTGIQDGGAGDQNQIMRTPHLMEEPRYSVRPAAAFTTTIVLERPRLVEVSAEGPLGYPHSMRRAAKTVLLIPGENLTGDGIVLDLNGYIVQIEHPKAGASLIAKDDVNLKASIRTLSGTLVRPHGDWDSRKIRIYGELLIGERIVERLQLFYSNDSGTFDSPFFVPLDKDAPDGVTLRVLVADTAAGNLSLGESHHPVLSERLQRAVP